MGLDICKIFSYLPVLTYVLGAQKNRLIETVPLSTHNICFDPEIRKLFFWYAISTKGEQLRKQDTSLGGCSARNQHLKSLQAHRRVIY